MKSLGYGWGATFDWEPSLDRAQEAIDWMLRRGCGEPYAVRAVADQLGLSPAQLRPELAAREQKAGRP